MSNTNILLVTQWMGSYNLLLQSWLNKWYGSSLSWVKTVDLNVPGSQWRLLGCHCRATITSPRTTSWRRRSIEWGSAARAPELRTKCTTLSARSSCRRNMELWLRYTSSNKRDQSLNRGEAIEHYILADLHLLRVYKYFRYSYIYSPLYLIDWSRPCQWFIYQWDQGKGFWKMINENKKWLTF